MNYFLDNPDLVTTFDRIVPWDRIVPLVAGGSAKGWVVAVGALALGAWLGSLAVSAFRGS